MFDMHKSSCGSFTTWSLVVLCCATLEHISATLRKPYKFILVYLSGYLMDWPAELAPTHK